MSYMFYDCNFNQNISSWNVSNVADMTGMFTSNPSMSTYNFTLLLIGWASRPVKPNVVLDAPSIK